MYTIKEMRNIKQNFHFKQLEVKEKTPTAKKENKKKKKVKLRGRYVRMILYLDDVKNETF